MGPNEVHEKLNKEMGQWLGLGRVRVRVRVRVSGSASASEVKLGLTRL